jgi:hypothetical protein
MLVAVPVGRRSGSPASPAWEGPTLSTRQAARRHRTTNRRDAADFEVPSLVMAGRSPSGSRAARRSLRVDTLASGSWPGGRASLRPGPPSSSAARPQAIIVLTRSAAPQPCRRGSQSCPWPCPTGGRAAASAAAMRCAGELLRVLAQHQFHGSDPDPACP